MAKEKEIEYLVHDDTGLKWEDLTEDDLLEIEKMKSNPAIIELTKRMKEEYRL